MYGLKLVPFKMSSDLNDGMEALNTILLSIYEQVLLILDRAGWLKDEVRCGVC
jgi:hypothetical protein